MSVRLFKSLLFKSAQIQQEIEQERQRRLPDSFRLLKLKKIRLSIKDRLQRLIDMHKQALKGGQLQPQFSRIKHR
jgi:uncharacterized protein YdcH (DUF465 family)